MVPPLWLVELIELLVSMVLLVFGFVFGRWNDQTHIRRLKRDEMRLQHIMVTPFGKISATETTVESVLVNGNVVMSVDYFKRFVAAIFSLFGGRLGQYEALLDRARREAMIRMKQKAHRLGARSVVNMKIETTSISKGEYSTGSTIEVCVYGTAMVKK